MKDLEPYCCQDDCTHEDLIEAGEAKIAKETDIQKLSDYYQALGNETRLKIIMILDGTQLCVCDIAKIINLSIPATSQQLKILRQNSFLSQRKAGREVYYSLKAQYSFEKIKEEVLQGNK